MAATDCLQIGMQEANKYMIFASKFDKNWLSLSKIITTKINYSRNCLN